ncbi:MAG TPA: AraC family transcriptional regulator [Aquabacterium sp.]|uniref:AraC family transcriptional regulator n=1 Tax=Aquabacterium sp. TaxID=1872578 RepID=UPI002E33FE1C|nr:AraC family transcriptional regulator [Aquabacterium sp.]HEX5373580.1 AraC family transcriptional regulator [Aquabacterium sp.]
MDALSELLADVRIRDAVFMRTRLGSQGVLRVGAARQPCFHLVTEGRVWLHPQGGAQPIALNVGDVAFFPQGEPHVLSAQGGEVSMLGPGVDLLRHWRQGEQAHADVIEAQAAGAGPACIGRTVSGCMHIEGVAEAWLWGGLPPWLTLQWGPGQSLPSWLVIGLAYLEQELRRKSIARQAVIDRLADIVFIQSLRTYLHGPAQPPAGWLMGLKDGMVSRVLGAMHREPQRPWQLAELARVGCVSRSVLAERFTQLLGVPPLTYLTQHRMHVAARRLLRSADPVAEVARSVGYQSAAAFAQAFRREFGCSPRDHRAQAGMASPSEAATVDDHHGAAIGG